MLHVECIGQTVIMLFDHCLFLCRLLSTLQTWRIFNNQLTGTLIANEQNVWMPAEGGTIDVYD